jgi:hypothetical protein
LLSAVESADIEAVASQIIPSDDSPGAREAGVVYFIDGALATFLSQLAGDYRAQLASFQAGFHKRHPSAASFASLTSELQIECLKEVDQTPFLQRSSRRSRDRALPAGSRRRPPRSGRRAARDESRGDRADILGAPPGHLPHGPRPGDIGHRQVSSQP